jgi:hypothetical protein
MPLNLHHLPFDPLYEIASYLDVDDVVHLSTTSRELRFLLDEETLCRRLLEVSESPLNIPSIYPFNPS